MYASASPQTIAVGQHAAAERYAAGSRAWLADELAKPGTLRERLVAVYRGALAVYLAGRDGPRGCFLVGTAVTEATRDEKVRHIVEATFGAFTDLFTERFARAVADGELGPSANPRAFGQLATATLNTLALRARTGANRQVLDALIEATVDAVC
jgi:AcrR family transcriptional regulator